MPASLRSKALYSSLGQRFWKGGSAASALRYTQKMSSPPTVETRQASSDVRCHGCSHRVSAHRSTMCSGRQPCLPSKSFRKCNFLEDASCERRRGRSVRRAAESCATLRAGPSPLRSGYPRCRCPCRCSIEVEMNGRPKNSIRAQCTDRCVWLQVLVPAAR